MDIYQKLGIEHTDFSLADTNRVVRESKRNSVYWNADTATPDIVDLYTLIQQEHTFNFFTRKTKKIAIGNGKQSELWPLHFKQQNTFFTQGVKPLGLGYGMMIYKSPKSGLVLFRAPLFILPVELIHLEDNWYLQTLEHFQINPFLAEYLEEEYELDDLKGLEKFEILEELENIGLHSDGPVGKLFSKPVEALLSPKEEMNLPNGLHLMPKGFLAFFDKRIPQQGNWLKYHKNSLPKTDNRYSLKHQIGLMPANPDSAYLLSKIETTRNQILAGCRSYDKLLTVVNLLSNALSNGKRAVVIAKNTLPLFQVQKKLLELGLGSFTFLLKNENSDFQPLVALLRQRHQSLQKTIPFSKENFEHELEKYQRKYDDLLQAQKLKQQTFLGKYSFTDIVGRYVSANKICGRELLNAQLSSRAFEFTQEEYQQIKKDVESSEALFDGVGTLRHPLRKLHTSIFEIENEEDALGHVAFLIATFKDRGEELLHTYITKQAAYNEALKRNYYAHYDSMQAQIKEIKDFVFESKGRYGEDFESSGNTRLSFYGTFSKRYKTIQNTRLQLAQLYKNLVQAYQARPYFEYQFPRHTDAMVNRLMTTVEDYEEKLLDWRNRIPAIVDVERSRLNVQTVNMELDYEDQINSLEFDHDIFVEELNQAQLLEEWQKSSQHTLSTRQQHIESIIEQLESTELGLRDFKEFYPWQQNWLAMPDLSKKIVKALVRVKPRNWLAAFESWYLHQCLSAKMVAVEGKTEVLTDSYLTDLMQVKSQMVRQIEWLWHLLQTDILKNNNYEEAFIKDCFDKSNPLEFWNVDYLLQKGLPLVSTFLPVLFVTERQASVLNQQSESAVFDLVITLESDNLDEVFASTCYGLGKRSIAIQHRMLNKIQEQSAQIALRVQSAQNEVLFDIKNELFYDNQLLKLPSLKGEPIGIRYYPCDGNFNPLTQTNQKEVEAILHHLNQISPNEVGRYPMIGIACTTTAQAVKLHQLLLREKEADNPIVKSLFREGLGIWAQGEQACRRYDEVMLSVVASPEDIGTDFCYEILESVRNGLHLFADKDISIENEHPFNRILAKAKPLETAGIEQMDVLDLAPFSNEVYTSLIAYFEKGRLKVHHPFNLFLPGSIVVEPLHEIQPKAIILTDKIPSGISIPTVEWEAQVLRHLEQVGYRVYTASAKKWWNDAHHEARKLAGEIIRLDNSDYSK